jgi:hypothetical protein
MPARLFAVRRSRSDRPPPVEGMAMAMNVKPSHGAMIWLPVVAIAGCVTWMMLFGSSGAETQPAPAPSTATMSAQNTSWLNPAITPTEATPATAVETATPAEAAPVDGLKISSQSWRRGGLGSKALVTLTLRNRNDYPVKDVEIACTFTRRDGSHLTDRKRTIPDTVDMKSRKTFARMLVGFVNIEANRAKCSLVTATRI